MVDTSDEFMDWCNDNEEQPVAAEVNRQGNGTMSQSEKFISDVFSDFQKQKNNGKDKARKPENDGEDYNTSRPGPSGYRRGNGGMGATNEAQQEYAPTPVQRAEQMIREAESAKARMLDVTGMNEFYNTQIGSDSQRLLHTSLIDESYSCVDSHVDDTTRQKIENNEYVDFARLLSRNRITELENRDRMQQFVTKQGQTYWAPFMECEQNNNAITNYARWECAFRVFSNIYTRRFPHRSAELIQYHHIIHTASTTYHWENVYLYDREFRIHMSKYPERSWAMILNQAYQMCLKDRHRDAGYTNSQKNGSGGSSSNSTKKNKDICWRYNRGRCTFGASCKFDHRCTICNRFGHGATVCRKAESDHERRDRKSNDWKKKEEKSTK